MKGRFLSTAPVLLALCISVCGCATMPLHSARSDFYAGKLQTADQELSEFPEEDKDAVLYLVERGTVRQAMRRYRESTADLLLAAEKIDELQTRSASKQAASFVVNDRTIPFRGAPFERTLVHSFLAKNFLARGMWEDAAVEARNIIEHLQDLRGYPDDAYSRYIAGFCLELMNDPSNAALQYRNADKLVKGVKIDDGTGELAEPGAVDRKKKSWFSRKKAPEPSHELVCFVLLGRSPTGPQSRYGVSLTKQPPYAEIMANGVTLGRSYPLVDTAWLVSETKKKTAALEAAKTVARVVAKDAITDKISDENALLGMIVGVAMFAAEGPDDRRWETLPRWLQVARVKCPPGLSHYTAVIRTSSGDVLRTIDVEQPIARRERTFVSFFRDLPEAPPAETMPHQ